MKGGYQIVDLRHTSLSANAVTINGVYEAIEGNYRKPILLANIDIGGTEKADVFVAFDVDGGNYTANVYGGTLSITSADSVTYTK